MALPFFLKFPFFFKRLNSLIAIGYMQIAITIATLKMSVKIFSNPNYDFLTLFFRKILIKLNPNLKKKLRNVNKTVFRIR